ncbi:MAG TPA: ribosomal protein S18-alanine N-acetyltransferase [Nitrospirae bacterium]|nr:ribosomal protein S18-alanine N-acetyltransferase [Nitrospirota bacterium]
MRTIIRLMHKEDLSVICSIQKEYPELNWSRDSFYKEIENKNSVSLVSELKGQVIGYIIAKIVIDEAQILNFFVHQKFREMGVGHLLMTSLLQTLIDEGALFVYLETRKNNESAIRIYERFGFLGVAIRKDYYVNPTDDGIFMIKGL